MLSHYFAAGDHLRLGGNLWWTVFFSHLEFFSVCTTNGADCAMREFTRCGDAVVQCGDGATTSTRRSRATLSIFTGDLFWNTWYLSIWHPSKRVILKSEMHCAIDANLMKEFGTCKYLFQHMSNVLLAGPRTALQLYLMAIFWASFWAITPPAGKSFGTESCECTHWRAPRACRRTYKCGSDRVPCSQRNIARSVRREGIFRVPECWVSGRVMFHFQCSNPSFGEAPGRVWLQW